MARGMRKDPHERGTEAEEAGGEGARYRFRKGRRRKHAAEPPAGPT